MKKILVLLLALVMTCTSLIGCTKPDLTINPDVYDNDEFYTIHYLMPVLGATANVNIPEDMSKIEAAVSEITKKEINAEVKITPYFFSEYSNKVTGTISSMSKWDVCWTSPNVNHYFLNIERQNFFPLNVILPRYAPVTYNQVADTQERREMIWQQTMMNGNIYGAISMQILPRAMGYKIYNIDTFNEWMAQYEKNTDGWNFDTFYLMPGNAYEHLDNYLTWLEEEKGPVPNQSFGGYINGGIDAPTYMMNYCQWDDLGSNITVPGVVDINDDAEGGIKVFNQFESEEFKEFLGWIMKWEEEGRFEKTTSDNSGWAGDIRSNSVWKPGDVREVNGRMEGTLRINDPAYYNSYIIGSVNAINAESENPARAMKFIELMSTNKELHNLLQFGIEGQHYNFVEDEEGNVSENRIEQVAGTKYDNANFGWGLGNEFNSYLLPDQPEDLWDQVKQINEEATFSDVVGFNFDLSPVRQKVADCQALFTQYIGSISTGKIPADKIMSEYNKYIVALKAAGGDEIVAEKQRQLDEWLAKQK